MQTRSVVALFSLLSFASLVACSGPGAEEPSALAQNELSVERVQLPTAHTTLRAGDPYSPVLDERPLAVGGQSTCIASPTVTITPGSTEVDASIVSTRRELFHRLDLGIEGVPINVRALTGATGTARLAVETRLKEGSLTLMLQAKGTFETALTGAAEQPPRFDPRRVEECGWGYVKKAYHRLSAVVMVTIESSDHMSRVRLGCAPDEDNCTPTSIGAGPVQAKIALERMLQSGSFNISLHSVADVIPDLSAAPFGSMVSLSSTPETSAATIDKLGKALDWLGQAQLAISNRIAQYGGATPPSVGAPTTKIDFAYYPGLDSAFKEQLGSAYDEVISLRNDYATNLERSETWETFASAHDSGQGHFYNVPLTPAATVDELMTRSNELIGSEGLVRKRRDALDRVLSRCEDANRTGSPLIASLVDQVTAACRSIPGEEWEASYDTRYGLRRLAPLSMKVRTYDEWLDVNCPEGQRLPRREEAALLSPFSFVTAQSNNRGLWIRRGGFFDKPIYIRSGTLESVGLFQAPEHIAMCFASEGSLFE